MSNNISRTDPKLDKLFDSLQADTPDISREELLALITTSDKRQVAAPMLRTNTNPTRRIVAMSVVAIIIAGLGYLLFAPEAVQKKAEPLERTSHTSEATTQLEKSETQSAAHQVQEATSDIASEVREPKKRVAEIIDPRRWEMFIHKPIDIAVFKPIEINEDKLSSLGLMRTDSGEVIYYHKEYKFGFPMYEYIRQFVNDNDPNLKILGMRPFYAQYVTDSRGNMMLHYENKVIKNGLTVSIGIYDRDLVEELKKLKYYGMETQYVDVILSDSINDISKRKVVARAGVMWIDTVITGGYNDQKYFARVVRDLQAAVRRSDSILKIGLGGMEAVAQRYAFDLSNTSDPLVKSVLNEYRKTATAGKTEAQILADKMGAVSRLIMRQSSIDDRLRLEQLFIKLSYEAYLERSKEEAAALANPIDLVPINIRLATGQKANPKFDNGLIFWYRDSDSLREILSMSTNSVSRHNDPKLKLSVMPNPATLYLYVNYTVEEASPLRLTLADITGKQVYTEAWKAGAGSGKKEINVQQFPAGIYMLILDSDRGRSTRQVIIQHQ